MDSDSSDAHDSGGEDARSQRSETPPRKRRSALIERIRIREEWHALKEAELHPPQKPKQCSQNKKGKTKNPTLTSQSEALRGVVVLVSVGSESRALPLRAALSALGATVVSKWNALVTHLVWADGGCRTTRAKARLLASHLVSPLWVEACAAAAERLSERAFPAAARHSDLPSPRTLRRLLKQAELENIPLVDLLANSNESDKQGTNNVRLRMRLSDEKGTSEKKTRDKEKPRDKQARTTDSSEDAADTSRDTSKDKTTDTSRDTTEICKAPRLQQLALSVIQEESFASEEMIDKLYLTPTNASNYDVESRVNTAKRRALPVSQSPQPAKKSRRKLFTQKEVADDDQTSTDEEDETNKTKTPSKMTQRERKILARAERMAQRMVRVCAKPRGGRAGRGEGGVRRAELSHSRTTVKYHIVLTGMSRSERHLVCDAVRKLGGCIQTHVNRKTTHVLLGSCRQDRSDRNDRNENAMRGSQSVIQIDDSRNTELENNRFGRDITNSLDLNDVRNDRSDNEFSGKNNIVQNIRRNIEKNTKENDIVARMGTMNIENKNKSNARSDSNDLEIVNRNNEVIDIVTDSNNSDNNNKNTANKTNETNNNNQTDLINRVVGIDRFDNFDTTLGGDRTKSLISGVNILNTSVGQNRVPCCDIKKARTLNALLGAARGCRVLYGQWALDSLAGNHWLHHQGYEVKHLKKISQNARVERMALERTHSEYGYDVFNGIRIKLSTDVEQRNAVIELLTLCGGIIVNPNGETVQNGRQKIDIAQKNRQNCVLTQINGMTQQHIPRNDALLQYSWLSQDGALNEDGGRNQNGGRRSIDYDILLGSGVGEISSKWVFDSVAAGRMRTIRRYVNKER